MYDPPYPGWRERFLNSFARQAMMQTLGVEVGSVEPGEIALTFGHDDRFTQQQGFLHAGVMGAVLDSACAWAGHTLMPEGHEVMTVEYKLNLLRPAAGDRFEACGTVVKPGRTLSVATGVLISAGAPDRPIATMTATLMGVAES